MLQVMIHNPTDYPGDHADDKLLGADTVMMLSLYPTKFETSRAAKEMRLQDRKCLLRSERYLLNLRVYSYYNCLIECRHNYTIQLCGCAPFFYPKRSKYVLYGTQNKKQCAYNHSYARTSAVLPDMRQSEKERGIHEK